MSGAAEAGLAGGGTSGLEPARQGLRIVVMGRYVVVVRCDARQPNTGPAAIEKLDTVAFEHVTHPVASVLCRTVLAIFPVGDGVGG